jgi:hypothetical protein
MTRLDEFTIGIRFCNPTRCAGCGGQIVAPAAVACVPRQASDGDAQLVLMDHYHARCAPEEARA